MKFYCFLISLFVGGSLVARELPFITIFTDTQNHTFQIEIASTSDQQKQGLMFRKYLGYKQGMLFLYSAPRIVRFWMKNTLIPLDLLFIDSQNKIIQIHRNANPLSEKIIYSQTPVKAVLELFAGAADHYHIKVNHFVKMTLDRRPHEPAATPH